MANKTKSKSQKKKSRRNNNGTAKKKMTHDQISAYNYVKDWVFTEEESDGDVNDGFGVKIMGDRNLLFDLHCHSNFSDGFLSPAKVVERARRNGVSVLALTDHDTMSGIPEALEAARRFGIKIIPGVEISTIFRAESGSEELVHVLAYYSSGGPARSQELDNFLANIREGRYSRAKNMISKLNKLKLPIKWENVAKIAGEGVAPGRVHVARAMVEAGHVENINDAFARYLYDDGPAYSTGNEPDVNETVHLIRETGGVAVLAHPWTLKHPVAIIRRLAEAGLHGIEVYRSDGKLAVLDELANSYDLLKLGGSDYHGKGGNNESDLGSVSLPLVAVHKFLKMARPIWCNAIKNNVENYVEDPSESNLEVILRFGKAKLSKGISQVDCNNDLVLQCLSSWLTSEEQSGTDFQVIKSKLLESISLNQ